MKSIIKFFKRTDKNIFKLKFKKKSSKIEYGYYTPSESICILNHVHLVSNIKLGKKLFRKYPILFSFLVKNIIV